jgi:hypothetical protein
LYKGRLQAGPFFVFMLAVEPPVPASMFARMIYRGSAASDRCIWLFDRGSTGADESPMIDV